MYTASDLRKGLKVAIDNEPYIVTAFEFSKPGKGQALYIGVPIFRAMEGRPFWVRQWIPELIRQLVPEPVA